MTEISRAGLMLLYGDKRLGSVSASAETTAQHLGGKRTSILPAVRRPLHLPCPNSATSSLCWLHPFDDSASWPGTTCTAGVYAFGFNFEYVLFCLPAANLRAAFLCDITFWLPLSLFQLTASRWCKVKVTILCGKTVSNFLTDLLH